MSISHVTNHSLLSSVPVTHKAQAAHIAASASAQVTRTAPSNFAAYLEQAQAIKPMQAVATQSTTSTASNPALLSSTSNVGAATFLGQNQNGSSAAAMGEQFAQLLEQAQRQLGANTTIQGKGNYPHFVGQLQELNTNKAPLSAREQLEAQAQSLSQAQAQAAQNNPATGQANSVVHGSIIDPKLARSHASSPDAEKVIHNIEAVDQTYGDEKAQAIQGFAHVVAQAADEARTLELQDKVFDFSTLLPTGTRNLLHDLKCSEAELNYFINVMVFGNKQGPHGKNVAQFLGQDSMSVADFKQELQGLMHRTQINSPALSNADFDFVLRPQDNNLGNTIALSNGADLEERIMERELDSTFKRDMALLQLLARAKDQNASIF